MATEERHPGDFRRIVKEPSGRDSGLAVTSNYNPGPHETKYVVEQLWPPSESEDAGRACGHSVLSPVVSHERPTQTDTTPEPTTPEYTVGTTPDLDFESSPDVAPDGSIAGRETDADAADGGGLLTWFREMYYRGKKRASKLVNRRQKG